VIDIADVEIRTVPDDAVRPPPRRFRTEELLSLFVRECRAGQTVRRSVHEAIIADYSVGGTVDEWDVL
jgi:hypothetical protein